MNIEIRADGAHISGYINATGKYSRPVITPHGRCIEVIEERAFSEALSRAENIPVTVDHGETVYASTKDGTASLREDAIGLRADDVLINDSELITAARKHRIRGWSFGMTNVVDELEQRAEGLPIRHIKKLDLDHITLVIRKNPCYAATSVEVRADNEQTVETRAFTDEELKVTENAPEIDYSDYERRIAAL